MGLGMLLAGAVAAALAALVHVAIFVMESIGWRQPRVWRRFGLAAQGDADTVAPMAFNQGFYNLFLAIGVAVGLVLLATPVAQAGYGIAVFAVASMLAASLVLVLSRPSLWRAALTQGLLPLVALVLLVLAVA